MYSEFLQKYYERNYQDLTNYEAMLHLANIEYFYIFFNDLLGNRIQVNNKNYP